MLMHAGALRLDPVRLGVRASEVTASETRPPVGTAHFAPDDLASGIRQVGPLQLELCCTDHRDAASFGVQVSNPGRVPVFLESVCLGFRFSGYGSKRLRFLRNGWQSWSFTGTQELSPDGAPSFPSGAWLRGMHHVVGSPPADRAGWHESASVTVAGGSPDGAACLAGVLETGRCFGQVYLRVDPEREGGVCVEVELRAEVPLDPGESRRLDDVRVALGDDPSRLLESFAELWGRVGGARTDGPFQLGWCSWYHFFHDVSEADVLRNLEALSKARDEIPVDVIQLDDGYQRAVGDWLETNESFPRGLAPLAADIRAAGFTPGIWTAPLCAVAESRIHAEHRDWLLRDGDEPFRGMLHDVWTGARWVHALDTTQEPVLAHLESVFRALVEMGFQYLKLDFLYVAAMQAESQNPRCTRAERLRDGLLAIRRGAGDAAFLVGCGCPMGPAVGVVDAMRIGPDVAPTWEPSSEGLVPGLEQVLPSTRSALRSILHRAWMHRRLWQNDPDCLMARRVNTQLREEESRSLAAAIAATGGGVVISDDVPELDERGRTLVRECSEVARQVDAAARTGGVRLMDLLAASEPGIARATHHCDATLCLTNASDGPARRDLEPADLGLACGGPLRPLLGSRAPSAGSVTANATDSSKSQDADRIAIELGPHESSLVRLDGARRLAVFCDFDGTFSVQDVGSTLARLHIPERREGLWSRYESGELTAWEYTHELLDGFALPETELDAFLRSVELDPGSRALVAWCGEHDVPFQILSDGFDRNLEAMQAIHGVRFSYAANHLEYEHGVWRIAPGHPSSSCGCGTGTCKGTIISRWRAAHPGALCVHIGNGQVSDLCGARAADLTFARESEKDTLGPALEQRGERFVPFETLFTVMESLEQLISSASALRSAPTTREAGATADPS